MNTRAIFVAAIALYMVSVPRLFATTDEQLNVIAQLGQLNGMALQCKYFRQSNRIKQALVAVLPKQRQLGQVFEDTTNQSFLALLKDASSCPVEAAVAGRINAGIEALNAAFSD